MLSLFLCPSSRFFLSFYSVFLFSLSLFPYTSLSFLISPLSLPSNAFPNLPLQLPTFSHHPHLSIHSNAPHFSRSCGIKIRAGTQLLGAPALQRPALLIASYWTARTWEPEALFSIIGIRWWFCKQRSWIFDVIIIYKAAVCFWLLATGKKKLLTNSFHQLSLNVSFNILHLPLSQLENSRQHRPNSTRHPPSQSLSLISDLILSSSVFKFAVYKKFPHQNFICIYCLSIQQIKRSYDAPSLAPLLFAFNIFRCLSSLKPTPQSQYYSHHHRLPNTDSGWFKFYWCNLQVWHSRRIFICILTSHHVQYLLWFNSCRH